ncbi:ABC transporter [Bifidobacterium leontopitheci]|uniref:ABC transporter n=1 Tax=Bifidobacterium leontopitheci TaxID=2650774 RepID=A0A6I1GF44_9BIFI|nr:ABC transporter [Bifidobacterium leontopitheci]KAB7790250.1 ABC transporter [Bifidobacterium leontopitheci]
MGNGFAYRVASMVRISFASSTAFATLGTALTTLVLTPLFSIAYDIMFGQDLLAPDYTRIGYAAALVSLCLSVEAGVVDKAATDRDLGIFEDIHLRRSVDLAYWIGGAVMPLLLSTLTAAVTIGSVFAFSPAHDVGFLLRVVALCPPTMIVGVLMGVCCAGIGVSLPDPYLGDTILDAIMPLTAGVIVPVTLYPGWLRGVFHLVPMTGTLASLANGGNTLMDALDAAVDLLAATCWAAVGLLFVHVAVKRLRNGVRRDII